MIDSPRLRCTIRAGTRLSARKKLARHPSSAWRGFRISRRNNGCMPSRRTLGVIVTGHRLPAYLGQPSLRKQAMSMTRNLCLGLLASFVAMTAASAPAAAQQQQRPPNILVIMGDDVGWFNIGAYHRGIMSGKTPNLDKLASEGMTFTDYYAEASCTAGRANFITGELPIRTGLTTVGQAGADVGIPAEAVTLATALKAQGYATGQFGKNHL